MVISGTGLTEFVYSGLFSVSTIGDGGSITLDAGRFELTGGALIATSTQGTGKGGDIIIRSRDSITISGTDSTYGVSGLFSSAVPDSTGNAGSITLHTDRFDLSEGGTISSATLGAGRGGDVNIFANVVNLSEGRIATSTLLGATGRGGDIAITAGDAVTISGFYLDPTYPFPYSVSSNSHDQSTGNAGSIIITTPHLTLSEGGLIDATSELTSGGNITLNADYLKLFNGSAVGSSVEGDETTTSGNVTINSINVVALNGSSITAKANQGKGGNITVNAAVLLHNATDVRDVLNASSQVTGNDGTVQNNAPTTDLSDRLTVLPDRYLNAADQIGHRCGGSDPDERSRFIIQGHGGLPLAPDEPAAAHVSHCHSEFPNLASTAPPISIATTQIANATFGFDDH
ncbi:MAG: hypothetical protein IPL59_02220 [Candidatus Competibacteraceae bacterium]|nr:hypothetical protein [Candidatus Competibacteraceae bacterium]